jgi:hypothetical protein
MISHKFDLSGLHGRFDLRLHGRFDLRLHGKIRP